MTRRERCIIIGLNEFDNPWVTIALARNSHNTPAAVESEKSLRCTDIYNSVQLIDSSNQVPTLWLLY